MGAVVVVLVGGGTALGVSIHAHDTHDAVTGPVDHGGLTSRCDHDHGDDGAADDHDNGGADDDGAG